MRKSIYNFGSCLDFDGANNRIPPAFTSGLPISAGGARSVSAWIAPGPIGTNGYWVYCEGQNGQTTTLWGLSIIQSGGQILPRFICRNDANTMLKNQVGQSLLHIGEWRHIAVTDNAGTVHLYIDGTEDPNSVAGDLNYTPSGTFTFNGAVIGGTVTTAGAAGYSWLPGRIDEVSLWSRILTPTEVSSLADRYVPGTGGISRTNLTAYFKMDESAGSTVHDSSGNGNTGTIVGTPNWSTAVVSTWRSAVVPSP